MRTRRASCTASPRVEAFCIQLRRLRLHLCCLPVPQSPRFPPGCHKGVQHLSGVETGGSQLFLTSHSQHSSRVGCRLPAGTGWSARSQALLPEVPQQNAARCRHSGAFHQVGHGDAPCCYRRRWSHRPCPSLPMTTQTPPGYPAFAEGLGWYSAAARRGDTAFFRSRAMACGHGLVSMTGMLSTRP